MAKGKPKPKATASSSETPQGKSISPWVEKVAVPVVVAAIGGIVALVVAFHSSSGGGTPSPAPSTRSTDIPASPNVGTDSGSREATISPDHGPVGTSIAVRATGFVPGEHVKIELDQLANVTNFAGPYGAGNVWIADASGIVTGSIQVPTEICCSGAELVVTATSQGRHTQASASAVFRVTQ